MSKGLIKRLLISLCVIFFFKNSYGLNYLLYDSLKSGDFFLKKKYGFAYDFAITKQKMLYEYEYYKPQIFQLLYSIPLTKNIKRNFYSLNILPQINSVLITDKYREMHDFEFGTNVEVSFNHIVSNSFIVFGSIGTGPHFISHNRGRQAGGFIFSDNFIAGFRYKIDDEYEFKMHCKFRHLSNANLKKPNWGINNFLIGFTFLKSLKMN